MLTEKPAISIIVPTKNRPESLIKTLVSIKQQTFTSFEVIIVDDGSSNDVKTRYERIWNDLDDRFQLYICASASEAGSGAAIVRNFGISFAKGKYIAFCDDDDYWCDPQHLEKAALLMEKMNIGVYIANQTAILNEIEHRKEWLYDIGAVLKHTTLLTGTTDTYILARKDMAQLQSFPSLNMIIITKEIIDSVNGFWQQLRYLEDLDLFLRVLDKVESVIYCRKTASIHHVPDRTLRVGLVPSLSRFEKITLWICVSHHVMAISKTKDVRRRCRRIEGEALQNYSEQLRKQAMSNIGMLPALQSLILSPSLGCIKNMLMIVFAQCLELFTKQKSNL